MKEKLNLKEILPFDPCPIREGVVEIKIEFNKELSGFAKLILLNSLKSRDSIELVKFESSDFVIIKITAQKTELPSGKIEVI